jgi:DNA-binding LacI/PurR family transcriptional regulator
MRDVAALAGVSIATVSRVVNGIGGVRAERVACVRHAVKQLGYRRDQNGGTRLGAAAAAPDHPGSAGRFP